LSFKNGCRIGQKTDAMRGIQNKKKRVENSIVVKNRIDLYPLAEVSSPVTISSSGVGLRISVCQPGMQLILFGSHTHFIIVLVES